MTQNNNLVAPAKIAIATLREFYNTAECYNGRLRLWDSQSQAPSDAAWEAQKAWEKSHASLVAAAPWDLAREMWAAWSKAGETLGADRLLDVYEICIK